MILGIEVLCEACGTELEITDVNTDHLLKVTLKARPCSKCSRPPDCQLSCEDVLDKEEELKAFRDQVTELEKKIEILSSLMPIEDDDDKDFDDDDEDDEDYNKPGCFGSYENKSLGGNCSNDCLTCEWRIPCMNEK